jgi:protein phosphatase
MVVAYSARSHVGRVREKNEDNLFADGVTLAAEARDRPFAIDGCSPAPAILAVCDGMGGEENGEIASLTAVRLLAQSRAQFLAGARSRPRSRALLGETVQAYADAAKDAIRSAAGNSGKRVGTTLALAIVAESGVHCFSVGDSRIYCLKDDSFAQVTNDHTLAADALRAGAQGAEQAAGLAMGQAAATRETERATGQAAADQARRERGGRRLTRCIGIGEARAVEGYPPIREKCRLLVCSDGLTDMVAQSDIERILARSERAADAADSLLGSALERGGEDNVTIIVADVAAPKAAFFRGIADRIRKLGKPASGLSNQGFAPKLERERPWA